MIGTYNEPYPGELHTPEGLFQSIPQAVTPNEAISAANTTKVPRAASTSNEVCALIQLNNVAITKVAAIMSQVERDEGFSGPVLVDDVERLIVFIDAVEAAALEVWRRRRYYTDFDTPECYLTVGLPVFSGVPCDLIDSIAIRARASAQTLMLAVKADTESLPWDVVHHALWGIRGQLDMIDAVLQRINIPEAD